MFTFATTKILNQIHLNDWKNSSNIKKMSDLEFLFSFDMYKVSIKLVFNAEVLIFSLFQWFVLKGLEDKLKSSTLGAPAPDVKVLDILSKKTVSLLSRAKTGRPLVLNFGSCSWPPFLSVLEDFGRMSSKFSSAVDFVTVYIEEAHPIEQSNFTGNVEIPKHQNMEQRIAASQIVENSKSSEDCYSIVVDLMDNQASLAYAALPERLYVVLDGEIIYEGAQGPFGYSLGEVEKCLENVISRETNKI